MANSGYGDFLPIATRSGVGTTRLYISYAYPESLRSLSGSTVHPSTGTSMRIQIYSRRAISALRSRDERALHRDQTCRRAAYQRVQPEE